MPMKAFTSCCGLSNVQAHQIRSPLPRYTTMSPASTMNDNALTAYDSQLIACDEYELKATSAYNNSASFASTSIASYVSSSRSPSCQPRLVLLPVAASSPSTTPVKRAATRPGSRTTLATVKKSEDRKLDESVMTTLMMHVYETSPYKRPAQEPSPDNFYRADDEDNDSGNDQVLQIPRSEVRRHLTVRKSAYTASWYVILQYLIDHLCLYNAKMSLNIYLVS